MKKRSNYRPRAALPPQGLRPRLDTSQVRDIGLIHSVHLDTFARGEGSMDMLWEWISDVLTWTKAAALLGRGQAEMQRQMDLAGQMLRRYGERGAVALDGPEYELAREGVLVMDTLASVVDKHNALIAAAWSEQKVAEMSAQCLPVVVNRLTDSHPSQGASA